MTKITKEKDSWGEWVIYVNRCKKFEEENPDIAPMRPKDIM